MLSIDKVNKTIKIEFPITAKELCEKIKNTFFYSEDLICLSFPIRMETDANETLYFLTNGWTLDSIESYSNITDGILIDKPEAPIVPSQTKMYGDQNLGAFIKMDDLLAKIPKEINLKSAHLILKDGKMILKIGGVWPNPQHKQEMNSFIRKYKEFEKIYKQYEQIMAIS